MIAWLKDKCAWVAAAAGVLVVAVLYALIGRGLSKSQIKSAIALTRLTDTLKSHEAAQAQADALKKKTDALAEALLAEELNLAAEKSKADALDPESVLADLKRRGLIK